MLGPVRNGSLRRHVEEIFAQPSLAWRGRLAYPPSAAAWSRRRTIESDVTLEHRQHALAVGRVAGVDDEIEDQAAPAGGQVELVAVLDVAATLDDDVGMRLEQADQLVGGWYRLAGEHAALGLADDACDQRLKVADHGPARVRRPRSPYRRPVAPPLAEESRGWRDVTAEQLAVLVAAFEGAAGVLDRSGAFLGSAAVIARIE